TRPHFAVVAVGAVLARVAASAERAVVGGDRLVPLDPIGVVTRHVKPARRDEHARRERVLGPSVGPHEMSTGARALCLAPRSAALRGDAHLMTGDAARHARELIARCELELVDRAVALRALDISREMLLVREAKIGGGHDEGSDLPAFARAIAEMTERALPVR